MKLRLLLVEDSPDDEALLLRTLRQGGLEVEHLCVEARDGLVQALREQTWDVVVSDFNLPHFDAMGALETVKESGFDLPFIIVSGTIGEDLAVEAMKRGAHDYVMKGNLRRLSQTIQREVKEAGLRRERRSLEEQVRQSQKMEAMGHLASSVAHDFNNLLTVMISFSQFAHDDLPEQHPSRADLREVVECGNRAAVLTRQLLAFSRKSVLDPQLLDLNQVVAASEKMLKRLLGPLVDYATLTSQKPAYVVADRGLLEQVLVNLIVNARDAMPDGGTLTVETANVDDHPTLLGQRVMLAITDTGVGMTDEIQKRIFEPFFTTKGPGRGTGLGLSTVQGIVNQCNGEMAVYSAVGRGTTFKLYLPGAADAQARSAARAETARTDGNETVLVVEDQEPVRAAVHRALAARGYEVLQASRPREALALVQSRAEPVHLVVSDLVLPEMSGRDLVDQLRKLRTDIAVLYMSGYAGGALTHQGVVEPGARFLQKPFTPDTLVQRVRATLDDRHHGGAPQ